MVYDYIFGLANSQLIPLQTFLAITKQCSFQITNGEVLKRDPYDSYPESQFAP